MPYWLKVLRKPNLLPQIFKISVKFKKFGSLGKHWVRSGNNRVERAESLINPHFFRRWRRYRRRDRGTCVRRVRRSGTVGWRPQQTRRSSRLLNPSSCTNPTKPWFVLWPRWATMADKITKIFSLISWIKDTDIKQISCHCTLSWVPPTGNSRNINNSMQVASTGWKVELALLSNKTGVNRKYLSHTNTSFWFRVYDKELLKTYGIHPPSDVSILIFFVRKFKHFLFKWYEIVKAVSKNIQNGHTEKCWNLGRTEK